MRAVLVIVTSYFSAYVLGGFLAAAADCAWVWITNSSRRYTQAQRDQVLTSARLCDEAIAKIAQIHASVKGLTMRGLTELFANSEKLSGINEELRKQRKVVETH